MTEEQRLDHWLAVARFFKSRSLAARMVRMGRVRLGGAPLSKPSRVLRAGDVLTISRAHEIVVVRVRGFAPRRLSAQLAASLYEVVARRDRPRQPFAPRPPTRPDRKARRQIAALKRGGG